MTLYDSDPTRSAGGSISKRTFVIGAAAAIAATRIAPVIAAAGATEAPPIVALRKGRLAGTRTNGVCRFLGVRYGEDTAPRRFRRAEPVRPWTGVRDATGYANQCPQPQFPASPVYAGMEIPRPPSEDCLFLNIWTPSVTDHVKRPVLVWLHGGGFVMGSGNATPYDGIRLVTKGDVVLVTVTHRINLFGHLQLGELLGADYAESANVGMLDTVMALEWVRDNIAAFGGDRGNVTIFGESGGGGKVHALMAMPEARGLFHRASVHSGGGGVAILPSEGAKQAPMLLNALDLKPTDASSLLTLSPDRLVEAYTRVFAPLRFPYSRPVIDGKILPRHPFYPDAPPISADVPLMVGSCRTEATSLLGGFFPALFAIGWEELPATIGPFLSDWGIYDTVPKAASDPKMVIEAIRRNMPGSSPSDVLFLAASYAMFIRGAIRTAELKARQGRAKAWLWSLDWTTPVDGGKWGSPHALDVPLFFDNVASAPALLGPSETEPQILANQTSGALLAFARHGDPGHGAGLAWPAYDLDNRSTMLFDVTPRVEKDPRRWERELFAQDA